MLTANQSSALRVALAMAEVIRARGSEGIPSGHLYAQVMGSMDLDTYHAIIASLRRTGLVTESPSHLLTWTGPTPTR